MQILVNRNAALTDEQRLQIENLFRAVRGEVSRHRNEREPRPGIERERALQAARLRQPRRRGRCGALREPRFGGFEGRSSM